MACLHLYAQVPDPEQAFSLFSFPSLKWSEMKVAQSCPTLCNPMDCNQTGSSLHGILQAKILEWIAISLSRGSSQPRVGIQAPAIQADSLPSEPPEEPLSFFSPFQFPFLFLSFSLFALFFLGYYPFSKELLSPVPSPPMLLPQPLRHLHFHWTWLLPPTWLLPQRFPLTIPYMHLYTLACTLGIKSTGIKLWDCRDLDSNQSLATCLSGQLSTNYLIPLNFSVLTCKLGVAPWGRIQLYSIKMHLILFCYSNWYCNFLFLKNFWSIVNL